MIYIFYMLFKSMKIQPERRHDRCPDGSAPCLHPGMRTEADVATRESRRAQISRQREGQLPKIKSVAEDG